MKKLRILAIAAVTLAAPAYADELAKLTPEQAIEATIQGACESLAADISHGKSASTTERMDEAFGSLRQVLKMQPTSLSVRKPTEDVTRELAYGSCQDFMRDLVSEIETDRARAEFAELLH